MHDGYLLVVDNKTDKLYEFVPSFKGGHENLSDIKAGSKSHALICPPNTNRFLWIERKDKFSKADSNV